MPLYPSRALTLQSPESTQVLPEPIYTFAVPRLVDMLFPFLSLITPEVLPVQVDEPLRFTVRDESLPTRAVPCNVWSVAVRYPVLEAPLQPSSQTEISTSAESLFLMATPFSTTFPVTFVIWNTCPLLLVRLPPVMVNTDSVPVASPEND